MPEYRFTYTLKKDGKTRSDIVFGAKSRKEAIELFEEDYPDLQWSKSDKENGTAQPS